jgi:predicted RNA binding protein YcfA (HicA-like mRNA interferase family)
MPSEMKFAELRRRLEQAGYQLVRMHGSHPIFARAGQLPLSIPVHHGKVKAVYVRQVERIIQAQSE